MPRTSWSSLQSAYDSKIKQPNIWQRLMEGKFAVTLNQIAFTSIGVDQAQEHKNKGLMSSLAIKTGYTTS